MIKLRKNKIYLKGIINNIEFSHRIDDTEYYQAQVEVPRWYSPDKIDVIPLKFKKFANPYMDGDEVYLEGNIRQYSHKQSPTQDKNKVDIYVFTYFDVPDVCEDKSQNNQFYVEGRICKLNELRHTHNNKHQVLQFILANNIQSDCAKLNQYIPMVAWDNIAIQISNMQVGDILCVVGELQSREYKKYLSKDLDDFIIQTAYEGVITQIITQEDIPNDL